MSDSSLIVEIDRPTHREEVEMYFTDIWIADRFVEWWEKEGFAHFDAHLSRVAARGYNPRHHITDAADD